MSYKEVKMKKTFVKLKNFGSDASVAEFDLEALGEMLKALAAALAQGTLEIETREVPVKIWQAPSMSNPSEGQQT
jgi:hypothetical protein